MTTQTIAAWLTGRRANTAEDAGPYDIRVSGAARRQLDEIAHANRLSLGAFVRQALVVAAWLHHETGDGATLELVRVDGTRESVRFEGVTMKAARFRLPF